MTSPVLKSLTHIITQITRFCPFLVPTNPGIGRPRKIAWIAAIVWGIFMKTGTRQTKKSLYEDYADILDCSYKTFVCAMNDAGSIAAKIIFLILKLHRQSTTVLKFTDATDIPVCLTKNGKRHKTMKRLASWGHSGKGWYYGLKLTLTTDDNDQILGIRFSSANANDRDTFRAINADLDGILVADSGYVSKELEKDMHKERQRIVLTKPRANMKKLATPFQQWCYSRRWNIEFNFRTLKLFHGLVTSMPRSERGYVASYVFSLLSFIVA